MADPVVASEPSQGLPAVEEAPAAEMGDGDLAAALSAEPEKVPAPPAKEAPPKTPDPNAAPVSREEFDKLLKKMQNQELFIQRQGNEIGSLRKLRENLIKVAQEKRLEAQEKAVTDPYAAMEAHHEAREAERQAQDTEQQEAVSQNKAYITQTFPNYEAMVPDIAEAAKEMGVPAEFIDNYRRNPYGTPIGVLLPYVKAAEIRKQMLTYKTQLDSIQKQVAALDAKPDSVAAKIKQAAKGPVLTGKATSATKSGVDSLETADIANLPYAEIEKLLKETNL